MKYITKLIMLAFMIGAFSFTAEAQKVGYINSAALLAELPAVKQAKTNLETLTGQLKKRLENQVTDLQKKAVALQGEYDRGALSPQQAEEKRAELGKEEQALANTEKEMSQQVVKKEQDLLQPILDNINAKIAEVAQENGYDYIFDLSQGSLLYYDPAHDLGDKVKAKLAN